MCGGIYDKFQTNFDEILLCFATLSVHVIEFMILLRVKIFYFKFNSINLIQLIKLMMRLLLHTMYISQVSYVLLNENYIKNKRFPSYFVYATIDCIYKKT